MGETDADLKGDNMPRNKDKESKAERFPASFIVYWAGKEVYTCSNHAIAFGKLGQAMGVGQVHMTNHVLPGKFCSNCVNENKNKG